MTDRRKQLSAFTSKLPPTSRLRAFQKTRIYSSKEGRGSTVKMDMAAIPKIDSVVLTGLDFSMRPENVRFEISKGFIQPMPELRVMHQIKKLALMVYTQEKLTPMYHANVCEGKNPLAYFLCAVHRQSAPQPHKKKERQTSIASNTSSESASSCASAVPGQQCELPQLCADSTLPLGHWDGLYYALVAEIRQLHGDLQEKFGWAIENGTEPLHYCGLDGSSKDPITPIELASLLESAWYTLMDSRLVATLDEAVRMRKICDSAAMKHSSTSAHAGSSDDDSSDDDNDRSDKASYERPPIVEGLIDVNGMTLENITEMLWNVNAPEVNEACSEDFEDESMSFIHHTGLEAPTAEDTDLVNAATSFSNSCRCHGKCVCHLRCDIHSSRCTCVPHAQVYHKIKDIDPGEEETSTGFVGQDSSQKDQLIGGAPGPLTEMQIRPHYTSAFRAASASRHPAMEHAQDRKTPSRYRNRPRTNTNNSDLAYVPESKSTRGKGKDAYPLGFYNNGSPGRYPRIRKETSSTVEDDVVKDATMAPNRVLPRKPVPVTSKFAHPYIAPDAPYGMISPPSDKARAQAAYAENERLRSAMQQGDDAVTQSVLQTSNNPRKAVHSDPFVESVSSIDPANDYVGLLARHPSSFEAAEEKSSEPFPSLTSTTTTTSPSRTAATRKDNISTSNLPALKALTGDTSKPMPPLPPLPEFIAPRPATIQRYVSAGGDLPLAQRAEITGPAFHSTGFSTPVDKASGAGISKAEIDAKMSDPEWVKAHFGPVAAERVSLTPPKKTRGSGDSGAVTTSQRGSRETSGRQSIEQQSSTTRDRTSSGVAKLKRVFSRKNSVHEYD